MIDKNIKLSSLQALLDQKYGGKAWIDWEPETIMHDLGEPDYLVMEKVYVLQALNHDVNRLMELPEFVMWTAQVANNEYADFEIITMPNSLELAWMIEEVKRVALLSGQSFQPSQELCEVLTYLLKEDGFSGKMKPFDFIPDSVFPAANLEDDLNKLKVHGIKEYLKHMDKSNV